jgi:hypothetical protein
MADQRRAGLLQLKVNGEIHDAKGAFTYNLGRPKRDAIIGSDGVHGFKETPQVCYIEGAITDRGTLDLTALVTGKDLTVTLDLGNDKTVVLRGAWWAGEGTVNTEEAEIAVRWEGAGAEEFGA